MAAYGGRSLLKMSDQAFDFVCTACARDNKKVEAVKYCVECGGYCCQPCTDVHQKFPTLTGHNLMEVSQGSQVSGDQSTVLEFPTERCSIHKGKVMDMYCEGHDAIGCYVCIAKDHKSCQDNHIHSIPDMIDVIYKFSDSKQTRSSLKDMMESMTSVCESKETQLEMLNEVKKEALDKVTMFQKALESIVRKAAESSKQEVKAVYNELENEILQDKHDAENINEDLEAIDEKIIQSEGNRAQTFVCSKLAQEKIKQADTLRRKQELQQHTDKQLEFTPRLALMEYFQDANGIGQVQEIIKKKHGLYRVKESRDITIKQLTDDSETCASFGCCLTHDDKLLVTDYYNKKLKRIDIQNESVVDYCTLDDYPHCVCCISKHEVAIACEDDDKIQFISIRNKMTPTRQIKLSHRCHGIAFNDSKLYVTDLDESLYIYDMTGTLLKTISQDISGNMLFTYSLQVTFNVSGNRIYVADERNGLVCFDGMGNYLSTITDSDLRDAYGVCVDGKGDIFVAGYDSNNVVQFSENGEKVGVVVKEEDGMCGPSSVCFHQGLERLFVTMNDSDVVKMYELK